MRVNVDEVELYFHVDVVERSLEADRTVCDTAILARLPGWLAGVEYDSFYIFYCQMTNGNDSATTRATVKFVSRAAESTVHYR